MHKPKFTPPVGKPFILENYEKKMFVLSTNIAME